MLGIDLSFRRGQGRRRERPHHRRRQLQGADAEIGERRGDPWQQQNGETPAVA